MASAFLLGARRNACGCSRATAQILPPAIRRLLPRSRTCRCAHAHSTARAIVVNQDGLSIFDLIRYRQNDNAAVLCAFDLIELNGEDLRWQPLERRKAVLADLLCGTSDGIAFNTHFAGDGAIIFEHACALGCEGIVSKRLGSPYRSGRVDHWLKIKNPVAPAARREAEEDWGNRRGTRGGSRHRRHPLRCDPEAGE